MREPRPRWRSSASRASPSCAAPGVSGLVLDGWAFDPGRAHEAAAAVGASAATALTTVARMAVSAAASSGGQPGESSSTSLALGRVEATKQTIGKEE